MMFDFFYVFVADSSSLSRRDLFAAATSWDVQNTFLTIAAEITVTKAANNATTMMPFVPASNEYGSIWFEVGKAFSVRSY